MIAQNSTQNANTSYTPKYFASQLFGLAVTAKNQILNAEKHQHDVEHDNALVVGDRKTIGSLWSGT